jgi:4-amino-4-deoxy-L-arabinose transferase-like glycosyltransferase
MTPPIQRPPPGLPVSALVVGGITLVGLALRLASFDDSLFGDEVTTYGIVSGHGIRTVLELVSTDLENTPPLFYLLAWAGEHLLGAPDGLRLASLLGGVAAIPLTYLLGAWTVGRAAGAVGALLIALSPFLIFYSTEARAYGLVIGLAVASTVALLAALERGGWGWWFGYAALSSAAVYTQYSAVFLLFAQFAWAIFAHPSARRALVGANVLAALTFLPWLGEFRDDSDSTTWLYDTLRPFELSSAWHDATSWMLGHPYMPASELTGIGIPIIIVGLALGVAALALRRPWTGIRGRVAASVPAGLAIYSLLGPTVFTPRNLVGSSPALAIAVGAVLTAGAGPLRIVAVAAVVGGLALGGTKMLDPDNQRPDYAGVVDFIDAAGPADSPVASYAPATWGPQSALEAAFGDPHEARPGGHPFVLFAPSGGEGEPPLARRHAFLHAHVTVLVYRSLDLHQSAEEQARRVVRLARQGTVFFVAPEQLRVPFLGWAPASTGPRRSSTSTAATPRAE